MNIIVCVKAVMAKAPIGSAVRSSETCLLNPFDRAALELALQLRDAHGGKVTALSMGPDTIVPILLETRAFGADRAVLVSDPALAGSDTLATSTALAAALGTLAPYDLLLFGARTSDSDTGQVGPQTAVLLDLPLITGAHSLQINDGVLTVKRRLDGYLESYEANMPAALTVSPKAVAVRDLPLMGIQTAFEQQRVDLLRLEDLNLSVDEVGESGSPTRVVSLRRIERKRRCELIAGTPSEQVETLVKRLADSGLMG